MMNDLIRWAAKDVDDCEAGITMSEMWVEHYEAEAAKVAFDAAAHLAARSAAAAVHADPAAAVWQVGDGPADRVILLAVPGPVTLHVNGAGPQVVDSASSALYTDVQGPRSVQKRKAYLTVRLPAEWRSELERRGLDIRQIVAAALEIDL